ncbi:MAG: MFS transporter [Thermoflexales bacterium]
MSLATAASPELPSGVRGYAVLLARRPAFRHLWLGSVASQMGDWFNTIALLGLLVELTGTPASASLILVAQLLPSAVAGLFISGVLADRFNRKHLMVICDLVRALIALSYLLVRAPDRVWLAYAATAGLSLVSAFFLPASSASTPNLVAADELPTANALMQSTFASTLFVGSFVGGVIAQFLGRDAAFALNALSFAISAHLIWRAKGDFNRDESRQWVAGEKAWRVLVEGFRYVRDSIVARTYLTAKLGWAVTFGAISLYSAFSLQVYRLGDVGTSWLYTARGLGAFCGPLVVSTLFPLTHLRVLRLAVRVGLVVNALGYIAFALSEHIWQGVLGVFGAHLGAACVWTFSNVMLQSSTPDHVRGRVMSLDNVAFSLTYSLATLAAGALAARWGAPIGALCVSVAGLAMSILWIIGAWKL